MTIFLVLVLIAIALTVYHATNPPFPLWPAVFVLCLIELLRVLPFGKIAVVLLALSLSTPAQAQSTDQRQSVFRGMSWGALGAGVAVKTYEALKSDDKKKALAAEGIGFAATNLVTLGVKYLAHEDRPCAPANCGADDPHKSFWSGHTANVCFAIPTASGKSLWITGAVLAGMVAIGRIEGNRHFWWDTVAGCGDGIATNLLMKHLFKVSRA